jgi:hypothetical protein
LLSRAGVGGSLQGPRRRYFTTPAHNVKTETAFVNAAVKAGVKCFIPSKFGSNSQNAKCVEVFPMMASKVKVVDYLKSKEEEAGLTWTAIATGTPFNLCVLGPD